MTQKMTPQSNGASWLQRRQFLRRIGNGVGPIALTSLLARDMNGTENSIANGSLAKGLHFPAKAKRVIYLFQSGAPS